MGIILEHTIDTTASYESFWRTVALSCFLNELGWRLDPSREFHLLPLIIPLQFFWHALPCGLPRKKVWLLARCAPRWHRLYKKTYKVKELTAQLIGARLKSSCVRTEAVFIVAARQHKASIDLPSIQIFRPIKTSLTEEVTLVCSSFPWLLVLAFVG